MQFEQLLSDFQEAYMPRLAAPTRAKYTSLIRQHIRPKFADMEVDAITTKVLDIWLNSKNDRLSWAARADLRNLMSSIFTRAEKYGTWEGKNPARYANPGRRAPKYEHCKLTVEQTKTLLAHLPDDVRLICMVALFSGLRMSEVMGLCWKHVDFSRGLFLIRQRYWRGDIGPTKSETSARDIPFGDLRELLLALKPEGNVDERFCFSVETHGFGAGRGGAYRETGQTRDDRSIHQHFLRPAAEKLNIYRKGFGFHAFRREAITAVDEILGSIQAMKFAGHSSLNVTSRYGLKDHAKQDQAVRKLQKPYSSLLRPRTKNVTTKPK
jgi:integrase